MPTPATRGNAQGRPLSLIVRARALARHLRTRRGERKIGTIRVWVPHGPLSGGKLNEPNPNILAIFVALVWAGAAQIQAQNPPSANGATPNSKSPGQRKNPKSRRRETGHAHRPDGSGFLAAHNQERKKEKKHRYRSRRSCARRPSFTPRIWLRITCSTIRAVTGRASPCVKKTGYVYVRIGENIADGQTSVDQVMTTWLESPPHRDNMMGDFTDMGAARIDDEKKSLLVRRLRCVGPACNRTTRRLRCSKNGTATKRAEAVSAQVRAEARPCGHGDHKGDGGQRELDNRERPVQADRRSRAPGPRDAADLEHQRSNGGRSRKVAGGGRSGPASQSLTRSASATQSPKVANPTGADLFAVSRQVAGRPPERKRRKRKTNLEVEARGRISALGLFLG